MQQKVDDIEPIIPVLLTHPLIIACKMQIDCAKTS